MSRARTPRDGRAVPEREKLGLARDVLDGVQIGLPGECWIASRAPNGSGYTRLHRQVAALFSNVVGREVHHLCANKGCVNPAHLKVITTKEHALTRMQATCLNGHDLGDPEIVRWYRGNRWCRRCDAARRRGYRAARKVAA